jgi:hypothetical protein
MNYSAKVRLPGQMSFPLAVNLRGEVLKFPSIEKCV